MAKYLSIDDVIKAHVSKLLNKGSDSNNIQESLNKLADSMGDTTEHGLSIADALDRALSASLSGGGSSSSSAPFGLREILRFSGDDVELTNGTTITIVNYQGNESQNHQLCLDIKAIGIFDSNNSVPVVLSNTENTSIDEDDGAIYLSGNTTSIAAVFNNNSIVLTVSMTGSGFSTVNDSHYTVVFYGE